MKRHKRWPKSHRYYAIAFLAMMLLIGTAEAMSQMYISITQGLIQAAIFLTVTVISALTAIKAERDENKWY